MKVLWAEVESAATDAKTALNQVRTQVLSGVETMKTLYFVVMVGLKLREKCWRSRLGTSSLWISSRTSLERIEREEKSDRGGLPA